MSAPVPMASLRLFALGMPICPSKAAIRLGKPAIVLVQEALRELITSYPPTIGAGEPGIARIAPWSTPKKLRKPPSP